MKNAIISFVLASMLALAAPSANAGAGKPPPVSGPPPLTSQLDPNKLPPASTQKDITYAKDIKPIFDKSCIKCHGGAKPKGGLVLETLEGALKGAKEGIVIVAGKSAESKLVFNIAHVGDEDDFMPPPDNKAGIAQLTKEQVGLIRAWIDQGAK